MWLLLPWERQCIEIQVSTLQLQLITVSRSHVTWHEMSKSHESLHTLSCPSQLRINHESLKNNFELCSHMATSHMTTSQTATHLILPTMHYTWQPWNADPSTYASHGNHLDSCTLISQSHGNETYNFHTYVGKLSPLWLWVELDFSHGRKPPSSSSLPNTSFVHAFQFCTLRLWTKLTAAFALGHLLGAVPWQKANTRFCVVLACHLPPQGFIQDFSRGGRGGGGGM